MAHRASAFLALVTSDHKPVTLGRAYALPSLRPSPCSPPACPDVLEGSALPHISATLSTGHVALSLLSTNNVMRHGPACNHLSQIVSQSLTTSPTHSTSVLVGCEGCILVSAADICTHPSCIGRLGAPLWSLDRLQVFAKVTSVPLMVQHVLSVRSLSVENVTRLVWSARIIYPCPPQSSPLA